MNIGWLRWCESSKYYGEWKSPYGIRNDNKREWWNTKADAIINAYIDIIAYSYKKINFQPVEEAMVIQDELY